MYIQYIPAYIPDKSFETILTQKYRNCPKLFIRVFGNRTCYPLSYSGTNFRELRFEIREKVSTKWMAVFVMAVDEWVSGVNEGVIVCGDC